jgi:hypothetical protein
MILRHHDASVPAVAGHHDEVAEVVERFGGDGEVGIAVGGHLGDLRGAALVHVQGDVGVAIAEFADHARQHVTRLRVGRGDGEGSLRLVVELLSDALDGLGLAEDLSGHLDDDLPRRSHVREVLPGAGDLPAHPFQAAGRPPASIRCHVDDPPRRYVARFWN